MSKISRYHWFKTKRVAAISGFLAVALGAFGAHGLRDTLLANATAQTWTTAATYHLVHSVVLLFVSRLKPVPRVTAWCFVAGMVLFSGALYVLAVTNMKWLGAVAPLGGLCLLAGWLSLAFYSESA